MLLFLVTFGSHSAFNQQCSVDDLDLLYYIAHHHSGSLNVIRQWTVSILNVNVIMRL